MTRRAVWLALAGALIILAGCERRVTVGLWPSGSAVQEPILVGEKGVYIGTHIQPGRGFTNVSFPACRKITSVLIQDLSAIPVSVSIFYSDDNCKDAEKP